MSTPKSSQPKSSQPWLNRFRDVTARKPGDEAPPPPVAVPLASIIYVVVHRGHGGITQAFYDKKIAEQHRGTLTPGQYTVRKVAIS